MWKGGEKKKKAVGSQEGVMVACLSGPGGEGAGAAEARIQTSERLNTMARRNVRKEQEIRVTWEKKLSLGGFNLTLKMHLVLNTIFILMMSTFYID